MLAWRNGATSQLDKILKIQKRAVRNINNAAYLAHTNELFSENKLLKVTDVYFYNLGIFMYQLSANELPVIVSNLFIKNYNVHSYPTRQSHSFHLPRTRTIFAQKNITFTGPKYWNDLSVKLTVSTSMFTFKRKLKLFILSNYATQAGQ